MNTIDSEIALRSGEDYEVVDVSQLNDDTKEDDDQSNNMVQPECKN